MKLSFSKMHGTGNDYIYIDYVKEGKNPLLEDPNTFATWISDRHFGVGSDGLIIILPSKVADFKMRMFNADGSEGKMCGNATRCIGKFVYEAGYLTKPQMTLETLSGIKHLTLHINEKNQVENVTVDMGKAILKPCDIPVLSDKERFIHEAVEVDHEIYYLTCVSMGNPHAVLFCDDVDQLPLDKIGPKFENHSLFPERVNTEFVQRIDDTTLKMRVWERGSGETWSCGTGACATAVAAVLNGYCQYDKAITVKLRGGDLKITYQKDGTVFMTGPAIHVFDGIIEYNKAN